MVWIKGPRCGIDNCASRFYQVLSGQRVCQHGHVQVGLETTGDDEDFVAVGHRIRRPRTSLAGSQLAKESDVLRGRQATVEAAALLQVVYKRMVAFLVQRKNLPHRFQGVARDLWALMLKATRMEGLTLQRLVALLYLATRAVDFPVLLSDFNVWIRSAGFPYFECWRFVDTSRLLRLPAELRRHFKPSSEPGVHALNRTAHTLRKELKAAGNVEVPPIDNRYVVFRLCRELMLAPQVYTGACRLLAYISERRLRSEDSVFASDDIPAVCAVAVAAKLYYGLDDVPRTLPQNREGSEFSWVLWRDLMRKLWLLEPDFGRADERLVPFWTGADVDAYLQWFEVNLGPGSGLDRKLSAMFPLAGRGEGTYTQDYTVPGTPQTAQDYTTQDPAQDPAQDYTTAVGVVTELCAVLHASESASTEPDSGLSTPGAHYQAYSVRADDADELPEMVGLLYSLLERYLGADESQVRRFVRVFEKQAKKQHRQLAV